MRFLNPETAQTGSSGWKDPTQVPTLLCLPGLSFFKFYYLKAESIISSLQAKNSDFLRHSREDMTWINNYDVPVIASLVWLCVNTGYLLRSGSTGISSGLHMCVFLCHLSIMAEIAPRLLVTIFFFQNWRFDLGASNMLNVLYFNAAPLSYTHNPPV